MEAGELADHTPQDVLNHHRIRPLRTKFQDAFYGWLDKQSFPVAAATVTLTSAAIGGFIGMCQQKPVFAGGPFMVARTFAAATGVNVGTSCVMETLTGKHDIHTSMVASFASGATFSIVNRMGGPKCAANAITCGVVWALIQGGLFKVGEMLSKPPVVEDVYNETRSMLSRLGLESYEKNFIKGSLTDRTLPLLNDSALRDASIPPGPRLLILDHIQRNKAVNEGDRELRE